MTTEDTYGEVVQAASTPPGTTDAAAAASEPAIVLDEEPWTLDELGEFAVDCLHDARERVNVAEEAIAACRGDLGKYVVPAQADPRYFASVSSAASAIVTNAYLARLVPAFERWCSIADRRDEEQADGRKTVERFMALQIEAAERHAEFDRNEREQQYRVMNWWTGYHVSFGTREELDKLSAETMRNMLAQVLIVDGEPAGVVFVDGTPPGGGPDLTDDGSAPMPAPPALREESAPEDVTGA